MTTTLLDVRNLSKYFTITSGTFRRNAGMIKAVDNVSFSIGRSETLGLVGESGCGKTTTGRLILRLIERTAGTMTFHHEGKAIDIASLQGESLRRFRRHIQLVFQDPFSSLNPRMTVFDIVAEPLRAHGCASRGEIEARVESLMRSVGLDPAYLRRYPHAFSGGQRQRVGIARALALNPCLVVCDEPVSALDVSVQAQILNLLKDLQEQLGLAYLFIAHDLSVVENISARVAVMYAGRIVEMAPTNDIFQDPRHPYTVALLQALPKPEPARGKVRPVLPGEIADPGRLPAGCPFHPRCVHANTCCRAEMPCLREYTPGHIVACHRAGDNLFGT